MQKLIQINWIEKGKQIGKKTYLDKNNPKLLSYIAIQKYNNKYIIYRDEVDFSKPFGDLMDDEDMINYKIFNNLNDTIIYIKDYTPFSLNELSPFRGSKVFNPKFAF